MLCTRGFFSRNSTQTISANNGKKLCRYPTTVNCRTLCQQLRCRKSLRIRRSLIRKIDFLVLELEFFLLELEFLLLDLGSSFSIVSLVLFFD